MILSRNSEGHIVHRATARQLAMMSVEAKRDERRPYALPPPSRFSVDETPATNEEADEITRYFDAQERVKQASHRLNRVSKSAPLDTALDVVRKTTLRTFFPTSTEVQEAFYQSQINPNYFEEYVPNKELMRGLATLYAEKGLQIPKQLKEYQVKRLATKILSQSEENEFINTVKEKVKNIAGRQKYSTPDALNYGVGLLEELLKQLEETEFVFFPQKKEALARAIEDAINHLGTMAKNSTNLQFHQADDLTELERVGLGLPRTGEIPTAQKGTLSINALKAQTGRVKTLTSELPDYLGAQGKPATEARSKPRRTGRRMLAESVQAESSTDSDAHPVSPATVARERARLARLQKLRDAGEPVSDTPYPGAGMRRKPGSQNIRLGMLEMNDTDSAMQNVRAVRDRIAAEADVNRRLATAFNAEESS